ncbi:NUDIX hydrolase [Nostocoides jenkinsii]|uniref:Nudix hydrolase domain-containing protein n=1 Tax=Nostocoides jenkinsii Ben 74 TaxID=1193518 RepID=A0A077M9Z1_9MICO|nr:NUDIX hydrolase [Tetrasphaera jenkinsii]CCI52665.1 hypothetical protein BN13_1940002 [Tetrasphaera jenkinsii Ben 74]
MIHTEFEHLVYENRFIEVWDDDVRFKDGTRGTYLRISTKPTNDHGVVVIPRRGLDFCLVKTYRYPLGRVQLAFPRGFGEGGAPEEDARRELKEETGLDSLNTRLLGWVTPDSGLLTSRVAVVGAEVPGTVASVLDVREVDEVVWLSAPLMLKLMSTGELDDAFTLSALMLAVAQRWIPNADFLASRHL